MKNIYFGVNEFVLMRGVYPMYSLTFSLPENGISELGMFLGFGLILGFLDHK
jgi:hypothetical protein